MKHFIKSHPEFVIAIDGLYSTIESFRQIPDTKPKRRFFSRKNSQPIQEFYTEQKPVYFGQIEDGPDERRAKQVAIIGHFVTRKSLFDTTKNCYLDKNARGGVYQFNGVFVPIDELHKFIEIIKADPSVAHQISAYAFERLPEEVRNRAVKINGKALAEAQLTKGATLALAQLKQDDIRGLSTDGGLKLPPIAEIAYYKN